MLNLSAAVKRVCKTHRTLWSRQPFVLSVLRGVVTFCFGGGIAMAARYYLRRDYFHTVSSPDLLLDVLPSMRMDNFIVWGLPVIITMMVGIFLLYPQRIPFTLKAIGLLFFVRSFFVILTPMGIRPDLVEITTVGGFFQSLSYGNDFFFSGHVSFPFMFGLAFFDIRWIRNLMFAASAIFGIGVILAHTHYSIDVFAVPFIVPTIYRTALYIFAQDVTIMRTKNP